MFLIWWYALIAYSPTKHGAGGRCYLNIYKIIININVPSLVEFASERGNAYDKPFLSLWMGKS